jgi:hypothetical protein
MKYGNLVLLDHSGLTQQNTLAYYKKSFIRCTYMFYKMKNDYESEGSQTNALVYQAKV